MTAPPQLPAYCTAAVFEGPMRPLALRRFALPAQLAPGSALCRVRLSTICGSDLHTACGRRTEPAPSILGHESVGDVVAVGEGARDGCGQPLAPGARVTWSIMASCSACFYCVRGLPQKCEHLVKYGHTACEVWPALHGGYAEYIYLFPGTAIFYVPETLSDRVAVPANCALATVMHAAEALGGIAPGETVLIAGAGLLGIYLAAIAREAGAAAVLVAEPNPARAALALRFGASEALSDAAASPESAAAWVRERSGGYGVDAAVEVAGHAAAAQTALHALRIGGRAVIAGLVTPGAALALDGNQLTRRTLTIRGIHNYRPEHLRQGLEFLASTAPKYPYDALVSPPYPLARINEAFAAAAAAAHPRVAVDCAG